MDEAPVCEIPASDHAGNVADANGAVLRMKKKVWHYVYLVRASDGAYYCGYALDPRARLAAHNSGKGAKSLRGRKPATLAFTKRCATKGEALRLEAALKRHPHAYKEDLARRWRLRGR